jgi:hypothetical protein
MWRLILRKLLVLCSFGFFATGACAEFAKGMYGDPPVMYGMPAMYGMPPGTTRSVQAADTQQPISGIQVSVTGTQQKAITSADGRFVLYGLTTAYGTLLFEDIDGTLNGEFYNTSVSWDPNNSLPDIIYMTRKNYNE